MTRKFKVKIIVWGELQLDEAVIDVVDDEWRSSLYDLHTPEEIAEHVAHNLQRGARLSMLDGWADQNDMNAIFDEYDWEVYAEEV
jgi:hypothetical protein